MHSFRLLLLSTSGLRALAPGDICAKKQEKKTDLLSVPMKPDESVWERARYPRNFPQDLKLKITPETATGLSWNFSFHSEWVRGVGFPGAYTLRSEGRVSPYISSWQYTVNLDYQRSALRWGWQIVYGSHKVFCLHEQEKIKKCQKNMPNSRL